MSDTPVTEPATVPPVFADTDGRLRLLADHVPALIAYFRSSELICEFCNVAYAKTYGLTVEEAVGRTVPAIIGEAAFQAIRPYIERVIAGETVTYQRDLGLPGTNRMLEVTLIPHFSEGPNQPPSAAFVLINDITKFHAAEKAIRDSEERLRKFAEATTEAIVFHENGKATDINSACIRLLRLPNDEIWAGRTILDFIAPESRELVLNNVRNGFERPYEVTLQRADGTTLPVELVGKMLVHRGKTLRMTVIRDISDRKQAEARIHFLAHHDTLTHLPNRTMLMDRLQLMLATARRQQTQVAVVFIDLDNFKNVNDSLGHFAGDQLLKRVAQRLQGSIRASDLVGRLGGDEFLVALPDLAQAEDAAPIVEKLAEAIGEPFSLEEQLLSVTGSIGISVYPRDGITVENLVRNADAAMYLAKDKGRNNFQFFLPSLHQSAFASLALESGIRKAIRRVEFTMHYQPQVETATGTPATVEGLIRWRHPELGLLGPDQFISIAEHRGLIMPIGRWVIEEAVRQARAWADAGIDLPVAINISAMQFKQKDLVEHLAATLATHKLDGNRIEIELTESLFMEDVTAASRTLNRLKDLGVTLAVDDFGTGYSSLSYLKRYPIDKIKIDRTFVHDIPGDADDIAITTAILNLAENLGLQTVAEGVENMAQREVLAQYRCDYLQGYLIAAPMPPDELSVWWQTHQPWRAPTTTP